MQVVGAADGIHGTAHLPVGYEERVVETVLLRPSFPVARVVAWLAASHWSASRIRVDENEPTNSTNSW